jgi:hypothetical protein
VFAVAAALLLRGVAVQVMIEALRLRNRRHSADGLKDSPGSSALDSRRLRFERLSPPTHWRKSASIIAARAACPAQQSEMNNDVREARSIMAEVSNNESVNPW